MRKITISSIFAFLFVVMSLSVSYAGGNDIKLGAIAQGQFKDLSKEIGLAISYVPLAPAAPLGILGFDIGAEVTGVKINADKTFWKLAVSDATPPDYIVFPKIHVQKGLPLGIDVGLMYSTAPGTNISVYGGEIKWAVLRGTIVSPAVAIRGSYTALSGVNDIDASTYGLDASISKGIGPLIPYAGVGEVWIKTSENSSVVSLKDVNTNAAKFFAGAKLNLLFMNFVAEADFSDVNMYSARVNVGF